MMAGVEVAHKLLNRKKQQQQKKKTKKKQKKKTTKQLIQIFDKAASVKTIYKQSSATGIQAPAQTIVHYILSPQRQLVDV